MLLEISCVYPYACVMHTIMKLCKIMLLEILRGVCELRFWHDMYEKKNRAF